jgi:hypothetical protein
MRHLKLYESYQVNESSGRTCYIVEVDAYSGPDYDNENWYAICAENDEEAKTLFLGAIGVKLKDLRNEEIMNLPFSDEFVNAAVNDGYFTEAGWQVDARIQQSFPADRGINLNFKSQEFTMEYDGWSSGERSNERKKAIAKMVQLFKGSMDYKGLGLRGVEKELDKIQHADLAMTSLGSKILRKKGYTTEEIEALKTASEYGVI